jgi:peptide deformylase
MDSKILLIENKDEGRFLRKKPADFDFKKWRKGDITALILKMRKIMHTANGVGLSANQIGLDLRMFVAEVPDPQGGTKFYAVFNPKIEKTSEAKIAFEEGCLSVPGKWGDVERPEKIVVSGFDKNGKPVKIKTWGFLARVFQHEIDHLDGKLFIDRTKKVYTAEPRPQTPHPEKKS